MEEITSTLSEPVNIGSDNTNAPAGEPVTTTGFISQTDRFIQKEDANLVSESTRSAVPVIKKESVMKRFITGFVPFALGVTLTILFCLYVLPGFKQGSFFQRLFLPDNKLTYESTSVPVLALFLFLWSVLDIITILILIQLERRSILRNKSFFTVAGTGSSSVANIHHKWKGSESGRTFRRIFSLLEFVASTKNHQSIYEYFRYQSDLDSEKATSKYTLTKIAIWTMPILGFIGTVLGIGVAVGHFSAFLNKDIGDIVLIKNELAKVATGLSYAFFSTLFGLALSMFMMFLSTYVQNFEEKYLTQLEETCFSIVQKFKSEDVSVTPAVVLPSPLDEVMVQFTSILNDKVNNVTANVNNVIKEFETSAQVISGAFAQIPGYLEAHANQFSSTMTVFTSGLPGVFGKFQNEMNERLSGFSLQMNAITEQFSNSLKCLSGEFDKISNLLEANNKKYDETLQLVSARLESMQNGFAELSARSEKFYTADLGPVLGELIATQKALIPVLEKSSKPIEIVFAYGKNNNVSERV